VTVIRPLSDGGTYVGNATVIDEQINVVFDPRDPTGWTGTYSKGIIRWNSMTEMWIKWAGKYSSSSGEMITLSTVGEQLMEKFFDEQQTPLYDVKVDTPNGTFTAGVSAGWIRMPYYWGSAESQAKVAKSDGELHARDGFVDGYFYYDQGLIAFEFGNYDKMRWSWVSEL